MLSLERRKVSITVATSTTKRDGGDDDDDPAIDRLRVDQPPIPS